MRYLLALRMSSLNAELESHRLNGHRLKVIFSVKTDEGKSHDLEYGVVRGEIAFLIIVI